MKTKKGQEIGAWNVSRKFFVHRHGQKNPSGHIDAAAPRRMADFGEKPLRDVPNRTNDSHTQLSARDNPQVQLWPFTSLHGEVCQKKKRPLPDVEEGATESQKARLAEEGDKHARRHG